MVAAGIYLTQTIFNHHCFIFSIRPENLRKRERLRKLFFNRKSGGQNLFHAGFLQGGTVFPYKTTIYRNKTLGKAYILSTCYHAS